MTKNVRKFTNFLLTPKFQLKLTYYYIFVGLVITLSTGAAVFVKLQAIRATMNNVVMPDFGQQAEINMLTFQLAQIALTGFVLFSVASFVFALLISHRIAGPVLALSTYIGELKKGNYDYGRKLRPHDELTLLMDDLHELSEVLKKENVKVEKRLAERSQGDRS